MSLRCSQSALGRIPPTFETSRTPVQQDFDIGSGHNFGPHRERLVLVADHPGLSSQGLTHFSRGKTLQGSSADNIAAGHALSPFFFVIIISIMCAPYHSPRGG